MNNIRKQYAGILAPRFAIYIIRCDHRSIIKYIQDTYSTRNIRYKCYIINDRKLEVEASDARSVQPSYCMARAALLQTALQ